MTVRDLLVASSTRWLVVGGGALAICAAVTLARHDTVPVATPTLALTTPVVDDEVEAEEPEAEEVADPVDPTESIEAMGPIEDPAEFGFVVEVGGALYIRLADDELEREPSHARAKLVHDDNVTSAVVPLRVRELPKNLRSWKDRKVLVDGTCEATVRGFAAIARVSGDPYYADDDSERHGMWTIDAAFSAGRIMIAARIDDHCIGTWARAADRPAIGRAVPLADLRLDAAARATFLASHHAAELAESWREGKQAGDWRDQVPLDVQIVQHSVTGVRWAFVTARKVGACGDLDINLGATYQIDAAGALTEVNAGALPGSTLESLLDLNGDGWFERVVLHEDDMDRSLVGPTDDTALSAIDVPFHGCGC